MSKEIKRREFLKVVGVAVAAIGVSKIIPSESKRLEKESVPPKVTSRPTIDYDVILIPSLHQKLTQTTKENIITESYIPVVEESSQISPKESIAEYNLLSPEDFAPYAAIGGPETSGEEILDYFPPSYKDASDSLKGLWSRAIDAKLRDKPQTTTALIIELATLGIL
jgi:hypothetical protein